MPLIRRTLLAALTVAALAAPALAKNTAPLPGGDASIRPQDDLFRFSNGKWLDSAQIPGDKRSFGTFMILRERSDQAVKSLLDEAAKHPGKDANARLIGDYYAALNDLPAIDRAGLTPLASELAAIDGMTSLDDVAGAMGALLRIGVDGPAAVYVSADEKSPLVNTVYWVQAGLGMPDRDYYLKTGAQDQATRDTYLAYLTELHRLAGTQDPAAAAKATLDFEAAVAALQWSRVDRRDALKTYTPAPRDQWESAFPGFPWERFAEGAGMPATSGAIANEASYLQAFAALAAKTPVTTWKPYLKSRLLDVYAKYLGADYRAAYQGFHGKTLQGLTELPSAWRIAVEATDEALGEATGARYVEKYFPPQAKARMALLVGNLKKAYAEGLNGLDWMTPATRRAALDKLSKFRVKIGYPDHWRGYAGLVVKRDDAIGNLKRANRFAYDRDMSEAGHAVDRSRWQMTPQTVNAYYSPVGNEIVFPAAILQSPFFDLKRDDAFNYGAIGAVIGHEMSHGFDDQGRRYDGDGRLRDWWTPADEKAFNQRTARLVAQYAAYEPLPGLHVNGQLTLGENIADLAGVKMALRAYHLSLGGKRAAVQDGRTGEQRFFLGYAQNWRSKSRPEWLRLRVVSDPHSPEQFRTNGVVTNLDAFYDAFGLRPGDRLYKKPQDRVRIW